MNTTKIAKQIAIDNKLPRAYKYDLFLREFDNMVEVVGRVDDPTSGGEDSVHGSGEQPNEPEQPSDGFKTSQVLG